MNGCITIPSVGNKPCFDHGTDVFQRQFFRSSFHQAGSIHRGTFYGRSEGLEGQHGWCCQPLAAKDSTQLLNVYISIENHHFEWMNQLFQRFQ